MPMEQPMEKTWIPTPPLNIQKICECNVSVVTVALLSQEVLFSRLAETVYLTFICN